MQKIIKEMKQNKQPIIIINIIIICMLVIYAIYSWAINSNNILDRETIATYKGIIKGYNNNITKDSIMRMEQGINYKVFRIKGNKNIEVEYVPLRRMSSYKTAGQTISAIGAISAISAIEAKDANNETDKDGIAAEEFTVEELKGYIGKINSYIETYRSIKQLDNIKRVGQDDSGIDSAEANEADETPTEISMKAITSTEANHYTEEFKEGPIYIMLEIIELGEENPKDVYGDNRSEINNEYIIISKIKDENNLWVIWVIIVVYIIIMTLIMRYRREGQLLMELKSKHIDDIDMYMQEMDTMQITNSEILNTFNELKDIFNQHIIYSKTNLFGVITEVSDAFCNISGYTADELIGHEHNIIRDPNMDSAVFKDIWETIESNKVWSGIITNLKKPKDDRIERYTVKAVISPIYNGDKTKVGYISIRHLIK